MFLSPWHKLRSGRPLFLRPVVSAVPLTQETQQFCVTFLLTRQYSDNFQVITYQPLLFSIFNILKKQSHVFMSLLVA